jgi:Collagen triple helix repeat (20 copies)
MLKRRLKEPFGKAGLIVAVVALVFAMLGGAYAATNNGGKATASAKAKQGKQGKPGKTGPAGPAGSQGPAGPAGANGKDGTNGANGSSGTNGESVEVNDYVGPECATESEEGAEFINGTGAAYACNGENGTTGFTETLPSKKTETGAWVAQIPATLEGPARTAMTFPIPLPTPITELSQVHVIQPGGDASACENAEHDGAASPENPEAKPGEICVYVAFRAGTPTIANFTISKIGASAGAFGASTAGAMITMIRTAEEGTTAEAFEQGTFAVTAP